jgi:hypothetical protein
VGTGLQKKWVLVETPEPKCKPLPSRIINERHTNEISTRGPMLAALRKHIAKQMTPEMLESLERPYPKSVTIVRPDQP